MARTAPAPSPRAAPKGQVPRRTRLARAQRLRDLADTFGIERAASRIGTEVSVLFVLRTRGPFYRSKPSKWVVLTSVAVAIVAVVLPYSPVAGLLQLVSIPLPLLALVLLVTLGYLVATELLKHVFWRRRARVTRSLAS